MIMNNDRFIGWSVFKRLRPGRVRRTACIRLPQNDIRHPRARGQGFQLAANFIVKILRHIFRRRIEGLEGFQIVHELVVKPAHDLADHVLEPCEIHQKPDRIELRSFERYTHAIIMAMNVLALAPVAAQGMSCGKGLFHADLKHISPKLRCPLVEDLSGSWPFRRDLPNEPPTARSHSSHRETGRHRPVRASPRKGAATPGKFYHRACAGGGYPAARARHGLSSFESIARILASAPRPPAEPEIPRKVSAHLPQKRPLAPPRPCRQAPHTPARR